MRRAITYVSLFCVSCVGESLDVGETDAGETGGTGGTGGTNGAGMTPGQPLPQWPAPDDCVSVSSLDVTGVWEGAIQDMSFRNQIPLRVEILGASELGGVCGTLRWGEGPLPPPPTDPERGWPDNDRVGFGGGAAYFHEGMTYTILDGGVREPEVRFRVTAVELWKDWCAIQTPHWQEGSASWRCLPEFVLLSQSEPGANCVLEQQTGPDLEVDVGKCGLCFSGVCACNQSGCGATPEGSSGTSASFDLMFEGNRATGTVDGGTIYTDVLLNRVVE
jgi:hypothetical protein